MKHIPQYIKDHSVSGEQFELDYDADLHMYSTLPDIPEDKIGRYYESEDYISHTDNSRSFFERIYGLVKMYTLSRKQKLLYKFIGRKGTLLDIGAGTGDFLKFCKSKGWKVSGVEPNDRARALANEKGISLFKNVPEDVLKYDAVTMWHVLEHVKDVNAYLTWIKKHLAQDGVAFIAVPNFESYDAKHYGAFWAAYDVPRHRSHFSKKSIEKLAKRNGLVLEKTHPMKFDAYYVSLLSEKYKSGAMRYVSAFRVGWLSNRVASRQMNYSSHIYALTHSDFAK